MDLDYWPRARKVFVDWGYRGLREGGFKPLPKRWVVGQPRRGYVLRTFAWMGRNRRLAKDYDPG